MILGSKPLADMSEAEMYIAIGELREAREALRAEAIAMKAKRERGELTPRTPRIRAVPEVDKDMAEIMKAMMRDE